MENPKLPSRGRYPSRYRYKKVRQQQISHQKYKIQNKHQLTKYGSHVLNAISKCDCNYPFCHTRNLELVVPQVFCFSRNPNDTFDFIKKIFFYSTNHSVNRIQFDFRHCETMGLCALVLMEIVLSECKRWRKSIRKKIDFTGYRLSEGNFTTNPDIENLLKGSQILKYLNVESINIENDLLLIKNGSSAEVTESVIKYIIDSLLSFDLELTSEGLNYLGLLIGEIVDNCNQHSGENAVWYTASYYSFQNIIEEGKCQFVILDFGNTIYEGWKKIETPRLKKKILKYAHKYQGTSVSSYDDEMFYTIFSLQQRASRVHQNQNVRGNGTVIFFEAFENLHYDGDSKKLSMLSITSGKCNILYDGTYTFIERSYKNGKKNKLITFNKENHFKKPPDARYVRQIKNHFPGTIISIELYIDKKLIKKRGSAVCTN